MDDLIDRAEKELWAFLEGHRPENAPMREAARAVVALVAGEAAKVAFTAATSSAPATERKKIAEAIRALGDSK